MLRVFHRTESKSKIIVLYIESVSLIFYDRSARKFVANHEQIQRTFYYHFHRQPF